MMGLRPGPVLTAMMRVVMVLAGLALSVATAAAAGHAHYCSRSTAPLVRRSPITSCVS